MLKKLDKSLLLLIKMVVYILLMAAFFLIMSIENRPLLIVSRTMCSTLLTFLIVGTLFLRIYGSYDVGRRKSKPIIYSLLLAVVFTDIVTYVELMIWFNLLLLLCLYTEEMHYISICMSPRAAVLSLVRKKD